MPSWAAMRRWLLACSVGLFACSGTDESGVDEDSGADADAITLDSGSGDATDASDAKTDASDAKAEVGTDAGPFDPSTWKPTGKGLWIWRHRSHRHCPSRA